MDLLHCGGCGKNDPQIPEQIMVIGYLKCLISDPVRNWNCSKPLIRNSLCTRIHQLITVNFIIKVYITGQLNDRN